MSEIITKIERATGVIVGMGIGLVLGFALRSWWNESTPYIDLHISVYQLAWMIVSFFAALTLIYLPWNMIFHVIARKIHRK